MLTPALLCVLLQASAPGALTSTAPLNAPSRAASNTSNAPSNTSSKALSKAPTKAPSSAPSSPSTAAKASDDQTRAVRTIALDGKRKAIHKVKIVPGVALTIELPELWKELPICGECVFGDADYKGQLFRLDLVASTQTLTIKNARLPGPDAPPDAFITNLDVTLKGGATVTFFVELTPNPDESDTRIEVTLPESEKAGAKQTSFDREMAQVFEAKVKEKSEEQLLRAAMAGTRCRDFNGSPRRVDQMVVRVSQMCRNGALVWVTFEVENRNNADLQLAPPTLTSDAGLTSTKHLIELPRLLLNQRTRAIVAAELTDASLPAGRWTLEVDEDGGRGRTLQIDGIEF